MVVGRFSNCASSCCFGHLHCHAEEPSAKIEEMGQPFGIVPHLEHLGCFHTKVLRAALVSMACVSPMICTLKSSVQDVAFLDAVAGVQGYVANSSIGGCEEGPRRVKAGNSRI
jgi:hypothetical protein